MSIILLISLINLTLAWWFALNHCGAKISISFFDSFIRAVIFQTFILVFSTEILSLYNFVNYTSLVVLWSAIIVASVVYIIINIKKRDSIERLRLKRILSKCIGIKISKKQGGLLAFCFLWTIVLVFFARKTVPYNWDSMTYHLARVAHWAENQSIAHYATNNIRQISSPPLAEIIVLHVYILSGEKDTYVNLVQCAAFLIGGMLVYRISSKIGCNFRSRVIALILYLLMPIGVGEAVTTQVDNVASLWLLIYVYLILDLINQRIPLSINRRIITYYLFPLACSLAFGYLTKYNVCIVMVVFLTWLFICCYKRRDLIENVLIATLITALFTISIIFPEVLRNIYTFHAFSDSEVGSRQLIGSLRPAYLLTNFIKNVLFNLSCDWIPGWNKGLEKAAYSFAGLFHVDLNSSLISEDGKKYEILSSLNFNHDSALNTQIIILTFIISFVGIILLVKRRKNHINIFRGYYGAAFFSLIMFLAILRWEKFESRYYIGFLAVLCPGITFSLQKIFDNKRKFNIISDLVIVGTLFYMIPMIRYHVKYVDLGRPNGYFVYNQYLIKPFIEADQVIKDYDYKDIGFYIGNDTYEYPLIYLLKNHINRFEHVGVTNSSNKYTDEEFSPECIICYQVDANDSFSFNGSTYIPLEIFSTDNHDEVILMQKKQ